MQGPRSGEFTRALARARKGRGGETRRRSTVVQRDARRLNVLAPAKEVQTLMPFSELRVVPLTKTSGKVANNTTRQRPETSSASTQDDDAVDPSREEPGGYPPTRAAGAFSTRLERTTLR